jgi:hypothetical protein
MKIREKEPKDQPWIEKILDERWEEKDEWLLMARFLMSDYCRR